MTAKGFVVGDDSASTVIGDGLEMMASSETTGGAFELFRMAFAGTDGAAPHLHRSLDVAFSVLRGRFTFLVGVDEVEASEGCVAFVPKGIRHAFRAGSDGGEVLLLVAPAGLEGFFRDLVGGMATGIPARAMRRLLAERYDSEPVP